MTIYVKNDFNDNNISREFKYLGSYVKEKGVLDRTRSGSMNRKKMIRVSSESERTLKEKCRNLLLDRAGRKRDVKNTHGR